jgi:hypothetical protein
LFLSIGKGLELDGDDDDSHTLLSIFNLAIASVVDFSEAQRKGFQLAYAKFFTATHIGKGIWEDNQWKQSMDTGLVLSLPTFDELYATAGTLLKGCLQHWRESVNRIATSHAIIPPEQESQFRWLISMLYNADNMAVFNSTAEAIQSMFPSTTDWLTWWLRIEHAAMLFPCITATQPEESQKYTSHLPGSSCYYSF